MDPKGPPIDALGIRKKDPDPIEVGVPQPTTDLLDRKGIVHSVDTRCDDHIWLDPQLRETLAALPEAE